MKHTITETLRDLRAATPTRKETALARDLIAEWDLIAQMGRDLTLPNKRQAAIAWS